MWNQMTVETTLKTIRKNDPLDDLHGWLVVDKPNGLGSTKVVEVIKKKTGIRKIGHSGTLDPDATGVLALALGEATKTVRFIGNSLKTYRFTMRLGASTDTDDSSGKIINQSPIRPETQVIKDAVKNFEGYTSQIPPKLSAIKVNGVRAYTLFHEKSQFELSSRPIFIKSIRILKRINADEVTMEFTCGKGGYVRSLARDIGEMLGCYGHAHDIRRIACGPFRVKDSIGLKKLEAMSFLELKDNILPTQTALKEFPNFRCNTQDLERILNGGSFNIKGQSKCNYDLAWIKFKNIPLTFGKVKDGTFFPTRVLNILKRHK